MDRLRSLFTIRYGDELPEELNDFTTTVCAATMVGFLFGGMIGARHAGDKYIAMNHSAKFTSVMQAQRELHGAAMLGFVRQGSKWGWKMGLFAGIFSGTLLLMSVYRDKVDFVNYTTAGAMTGGLFRVRAGIKPAIGGTVLGTLLSLPAGVLLQGLDRLLVGKQQHEKMRRMKFNARRRKEEEWQSKLEATTRVIEDINQPQGLKNYFSVDSRSDEETKHHNVSDKPEK